jgi:O-antigen/teichoic acid export membrane protein
MMRFSTQLYKVLQLKNNSLAYFYAFLDQAFSLSAVFVVNILLARTLSQSDYGGFALYFSLLGFLSGIHNAGILEVFTIFSSGCYREKFSEYLNFAFDLNRKLIIFITFIFILIISLKHYFLHSYDFSLIALSFSIGLVMLNSFARRVNYSAGNYLQQFKNSFFYFLIVVSLLFIGYWLKVLTVSYVLLILGVACLPSFFQFNRLFIKIRPLTFLEDSPGYWGMHWKHSKWIVATAFVIQIFLYSSYWIIGLFSSVEEVASFRAFQNIVLPINLFFISLSYILVPKMARIYHEYSFAAFHKLVNKSLLFVGCISFVFVLIMIFCGTWLLELVYGLKYQDNSYNSVILILSSCLLGFAGIFNDALKAAGNSKYNFYGYLCGALFSLSLGVYLIKVYHLTGACYGNLISSFVYFFILFAGYKRLPS